MELKNQDFLSMQSLGTEVDGTGTGLGAVLSSDPTGFSQTSPKQLAVAQFCCNFGLSPSASPTGLLEGASHLLAVFLTCWSDSCTNGK